LISPSSFDQSTANNQEFPFHSFAFGLALACNVAVPGLRTAETVSRPDVSILLGSLRVDRDSVAEQELFLRSGDKGDGEANLRVWRSDRGEYRIEYHDGTEFLISHDGSVVWGTWSTPMTLEDTATYLLGPIMGLVLRLRGTTCLHASAAQIDPNLAVFVGQAGAGKSSLCAAFSLAGYPVSGDDVLPIVLDGDEVRACAAYGRVRLWPDSAAALCGHENKLPRLTPTWDKRYLSVEEEGRSLTEGYVDVGLVYVLSGDSNHNDVKFEQLSAREAIVALVANTYANYLINPEMKATELEFLSKVVAHCPVFRLTLPRDLKRLRSNAEIITEHFRGQVS
jgi:hypothetical protein